MKYLIAADLEGVHGVVGVRYEKLRENEEYDKAVEAAALEINCAVRALFDSGAELVAVWDNHGGGGNIAPEKIDKRAIYINAKGDKSRFDFAKKFDFDGILFIGYHSMEGTPRGVLAHTYNSSAIQYARLNGEDIGELGVDTYICDSLSIAPIFIASDAAGVVEMKKIRPDIESVITKYGKSRNSADLKDRDTVLAEIYDGVRAAAKLAKVPFNRPFPERATLEVRYTRAERAEDKYAEISDSAISVAYGDDSHTLSYTINKATEIPKLL